MNNSISFVREISFFSRTSCSICLGVLKLKGLLYSFWNQWQTEQSHWLRMLRLIPKSHYILTVLIALLHEPIKWQHCGQDSQSALENRRQNRFIKSYFIKIIHYFITKSSRKMMKKLINLHLATIHIFGRCEDNLPFN